jgi:transcriptional regulator with XRE-family HTH domain
MDSIPRRFRLNSLNPAGQSQPTLAERLDRLFEVSRPPHAPERCWRNNEVVAACKADGRELSESHLSELRRGIKRNPTMRTLEALAWFFDVRVGYFVDPDVAREVERELDERAARLASKVEEERRAQEEERDAALALQKAIRESGVTKTAHRAGDGRNRRQRASMMRALARALIEDENEDSSESHH